MPSCTFHVGLLLMAPLLLSGCGSKFDESSQASGRGSSRSARAKQDKTPPRKAGAARSDDVVLGPEESMRRDLDTLRAREKQQAKMIQEMKKSLSDGQSVIQKEEDKLAEIRDQVGQYETTLARLPSPQSSPSKAPPSRTRATDPAERDYESRNQAAARGGDDSGEMVFDSRPPRQGQDMRRNEYSNVPESVTRGPFSAGVGARTAAPSGVGRTARPDEGDPRYGQAYPGYGAMPESSSNQPYNPNPFAGAPRGAAVQTMPSSEQGSDMPPSPFRVSALDRVGRDSRRPIRRQEESVPAIAATTAGAVRRDEAEPTATDDLAYGRGARDESFTPDLYFSASR